MNQSNLLLHPVLRRLGVPFSWAVIAVCLARPDLATAQIPFPTATGEMLLCESAAASRVVEKVRSQVQGVMMETYVKVGDAVKKGQLLGHAELDATKLQLDLAQHTMDAKANVESARNQAEAWAVTREETEEAVRRRKAEKSRLDWATAMEGMYRGTYEAQVEAESLQRIQYEYWKQQYEKRFFRAPVDGVVSEVLVEVGKPLNFATHLFTIRNEDTFSIPVTVPADLADAAASQKDLPVRTADGKSVSQAQVDGVADDPRQAGCQNHPAARPRHGFPSSHPHETHGHEVRRAAAPSRVARRFRRVTAPRSILNPKAEPPKLRPCPSREAALELARRLRAAGHEAFFAGGCVRDRLLGLEPKDYDIATSATPAQVIQLFPGANEVGAHFGVVIAKHGGHHVEIATFRTDGSYKDGRRPDNVTFSTPEEDAERRDFTVNGLFERSGHRRGDRLRRRRGGPPRAECFARSAIRWRASSRTACA